jgi:hypothetical protein
MFYPSTYFDTCNGLLPQVVLSSMLLQAANERSKAYAGVFLTDISQSTTFALAGDLSDVSYLSISGWLPIAEARYLITQQSIVSRVSAMNAFNVVAFTDIIGLPQAGFNPRNLPAVVLPVGIDHLSRDELVLEKRLAYLLIRLHKRNLLYNLYNIVRAIFVNSITNTVSIVGTNYVQSANKVLHIPLVNYCLGRLFTDYPRLEIIIFGSASSYTDPTRLETISGWLLTQLQSSNPELIPSVDLEFIRNLLGDVYDYSKDNTTEAYSSNEPTLTTVTAAGDVSSEIKSAGGSSRENSVPILPLSFFGDNDSKVSSDSPIEPRSNSPLNQDTPVNSLPEC